MTLSSFRQDFAESVEKPLSELISKGGTVYFATPLRKVGSGYLPTAVSVDGLPFSDVMVLGRVISPYETEDKPISLLAKAPSVSVGWEKYE